ncbi:MAG TPA: hypothetical protein VI423_08970 [Paenisporosarcina sp.]|nr:hypothetical protein [Paenisporosarcina sp.]
MSSDYYPRKNSCDKKERCSGDTVNVTFTAGVSTFPITASSVSGNVDSACIGLLTPTLNVTPALACLFEDGFEIVAFTSNAAAVTYTLRRC